MVTELREDLDLIALDFDLVYFNFRRRVLHAFSGGDVELPAVPGTGDDFTVDVAFAQRSDRKSTRLNSSHT